MGGRAAIGAVRLHTGEAGGSTQEKPDVTDRALIGSQTGETVLDITDIAAASSSVIIDGVSWSALPTDVVVGTSQAIGDIAGIA